MSTVTLAKALEQTTTPDLSFKRELVLADRCDACPNKSSAAYVRAWKDGVGELLFCGHHGKAYEASLVGQGFDIDDQTARLFKNTKPMSGSNMAD